MEHLMEFRSKEYGWASWKSENWKCSFHLEESKFQGFIVFLCLQQVTAFAEFSLSIFELLLGIH